MDPNATLKEMRQIAADIIRDEYTPKGFMEASNRLAELVQALDGWIRDGGFLPSAWTRGGEC